MAASRIRIDYEKMNQIARTFEQRGGVVRAMTRKLKENMGVLQAGDWIGRGADKFYQEMDLTVLPSMQRLAAALEAGCRTTSKIVQMMRQAEEDAATLFRQPETVGATESTGSATSTPNGNGQGVSAVHRTPIAARGTKEPIKDGISIDDINQGGYGDCFVMAPAAALAKTRPDLLAKRIHDNGDGTYDVSLYHRPRPDEIVLAVANGKEPGWQTTRVSQADLAKHPQFQKATSKNPDELWPALIEEAYIQQRAQRGELGILGEFGSFGQHAAAVQTGGYPDVALEVLTGVPSKTFVPDDMSITDLKKQIDAQNPVVVSTPEDWSLTQHVMQNIGAKEYGDRLVPSHAYTVTGVDTTNNTVTVRNPWGNGPTQTSPYLTMPYSAFQMMFENGAVSPLNK